MYLLYSSTAATCRRSVAHTYLVGLLLFDSSVASVCCHSRPSVFVCTHTRNPSRPPRARVIFGVASRKSRHENRNAVDLYDARRKGVGRVFTSGFFFLCPREIPTDSAGAIISEIFQRRDTRTHALSSRGPETAATTTRFTSRPVSTRARFAYRSD